MKNLILRILLVLAVISLQQSCKSDSTSDTIITPPTDDKICAGGDGMLCNVAGKAGNPGGAGNGGNALDATLYWPQDICMDASGKLMIVDWNNHCVRRISADGTVSDMIGSGFLGDGTSGPATGIELNHPSDVCLDPAGNYWLTAWHNWKLKKIDATTMMVSALVGTSQGYSGDNGPATAAQLNFPTSTVFDGSGNLFFSDAGNQRIRRVDATTNIITTFVGSGVKGFADGTGSAAQLSMPVGTNAVPGGKLAMSNDKQFMYCADTENHRIRKIEIATGIVTTIAGTGVSGFSGDGSAALSAQLNFPTDVAVAPDNSIYIADARNHCIRKINNAGIMTTVAGTPGTSGYSANSTMAKSAKLNTPSGVYVSADNTLYIADTYNHQVKKVHNPN